MKTFLALLLLLNSALLAGVAPGIDTGTVALYKFENNANDSSGNGHTLTSTSPAVPFVTSPAYEGTYATGTFTTSAYYTLPASLVNALKNKSTYIIECYVYWLSLDAAQQMIFVLDAGGHHLSLETKNTTGLEIQQNGGFTPSTGLTLTTGEWWYIAVTNNGTNMKVYASKASAISQTPLGNLNALPSLTLSGSLSGGAIGIYTGSLNLPLTAYVDKFRFSTVIPATLPTADMKSLPFNVGQRIPSNTLAYRPMNNDTADIVDGVNTYPVVLNANAPAYVSGPGLPPGGGYSTGPYAASTGTTWIEQAPLRSIFGGLSTWSVEFDIYSTDYSGNPVLAMFGTNGNVADWWLIQAFTSGKLRMSVNADALNGASTATNLFPTSTWLHVAWERDGNTLNGYICPSDTTTTTPAITLDVTGRSNTNVPTFQYGQYYMANTNNFSGYMKNFQISNRAYKRYPSVDRPMKVTR